MLNHQEIKTDILQLAQQKSVLTATEFLLKEYDLFPTNLELALRPNDANNALVVTTEGDFGLDKIQTVRVPENLFEFPMEMVVNLLAHEMVHVHQKTNENVVLDKNEREFQAYSEGVFPEMFLNLPPSPIWLKKQLATQAIRYYNQMGEGSVLQVKYYDKMILCQEFLNGVV